MWSSSSVIYIKGNGHMGRDERMGHGGDHSQPGDFTQAPERDRRHGRPRQQRARIRSTSTISPNLMCVVKETFRSHSPGPFAIPRESMTDTTLDGCTIPRGTRVLINMFSLDRPQQLMRPGRTPSLTFRPERRQQGNDNILTAVHDSAFRILPLGYGRRQ